MAKAFEFNVGGVIKGLNKLKGFDYPEIKAAMGAASTLIQEHARDNHPRWPDVVSNPDGTIRYHNVTATLTRSISVVPTKVSSNFVEGGAFTNLEYAPVIEFKHPFLSTALLAQKNNIQKVLESGVRLVLKRI